MIKIKIFYRKGINMKNFSKYIVIIFVGLLSPLGGQDQSFAKESSRDIQSLIDFEYSSLEKLYCDLHRYPELSFHEQNTSARLVRELRDIGFEVSSSIGGFGIVGVLKNGNGPAVLVRTDMDALPIEEKTNLPYASTVTVKNDRGEDVGVMHACGHDIHMTVFIGTARLLAQMKESWSGTLIMVGQPAEERGAGAKAMIKEGLFEYFPVPDYCLALHVDPQLSVGKVSYYQGYTMANVDSVDIVMKGVGGHGASPHVTKDPIVMAAQVILALQTIVSREIDPQKPAVITVGSIHSGTKHNIISDKAHLQLTVRSYSDEVRSQLLTAIQRIATGVALSAGVPKDKMPVVTIKDEYTPSLYNDPMLTERIAKAFQSTLGQDNVVLGKPEMIGEDFSRYGRTKHNIPICMFRLGAIEEGRKNGPLPSLHSATFAPIPEPTVKTGVRAMVAAVLELLGARGELTQTPALRGIVRKHALVYRP